MIPLLKLHIERSLKTLIWLVAPFFIFSAFLVSMGDENSRSDLLLPVDFWFQILIAMRLGDVSLSLQGWQRGLPNSRKMLVLNFISQILMLMILSFSCIFFRNLFVENFWPGFHYPIEFYLVVGALLFVNYKAAAKEVSHLSWKWPGLLWIAGVFAAASYPLLIPPVVGYFIFHWILVAFLRLEVPSLTFVKWKRWLSIVGVVLVGAAILFQLKTRA